MLESISPFETERKWIIYGLPNLQVALQEGQELDIPSRKFDKEKKIQQLSVNLNCLFVNMIYT